MSLTEKTRRILNLGALTMGHALLAMSTMSAVTTGSYVALTMEGILIGLYLAVRWLMYFSGVDLVSVFDDSYGVHGVQYMLTMLYVLLSDALVIVLAFANPLVATCASAVFVLAVMREARHRDNK